jgi:DNA-binding Xre family transcriptional regulator
MMAQFWKVDYQWRLREVMAANGMHATSDIIPHLAEHGITMSTSQAHRLVTGRPDRLNLSVLSALCHILGVTADELIPMSADLLNVRPRAVGEPARQPRRSGSAPAVRPVRATVGPEPELDG